MTKNKQSKVKAIKLDFSPAQQVTSFGGLAVTERLLARLGLKRLLEKSLPARAGYSLTEISCAAIAGFLSGAAGTFVTQSVRHDSALLALLGLERAPEEATFWRSTEQAGSTEALDAFAQVTAKFARRTLEHAPRKSVVERSGFVPVFFDGSLLEGSPLREGTKTLGEKGTGLLWTAAFVAGVPAAQYLCGAGEGEGEATAVRTLLRRVDGEVLRPAGLHTKALVLMDSLHGNGPTLDLLDELGLKYIVGARGLIAAEKALAEQPESQWSATPEYDQNHPGIEDSAICVATVQCEQWQTKRTIIGRRWRKKGELIYNYSALLTNLECTDERLKADGNNAKFARAVGALYNRKGACENHFKNLLSDLRLHHPPCREHQRNAGFYAMGFLAGLVCVATDILTSPPGLRRRRIATLRRWLFAAPARIITSGRTAHVTILGLSEWWRSRIHERFHRAARC